MNLKDLQALLAEKKGIDEACIKATVELYPLGTRISFFKFGHWMNGTVEGHRIDGDLVVRSDRGGRHHVCVSYFSQPQIIYGGAR